MDKATPASIPEPARLAPVAWAGLVATALVSLAAGGAAAQSMNNGSSRFNSGYGGSGQLNQPINIGTRDENNNQVFINGVMQTPSGSVFSSTSGFSQSSAGGGVGGSGLATAIGNNLNVVVQGSWNRVTIDSTQINNGQVTANANLNGQIQLDGP